MKLRIIKTLLLCLFLFHFSCATFASIPKDTCSYVSQSSQVQSPKEVIIQFLKWYKINIEKINKFPILIKDSADNFMINKTACNNYLKFLNSSKCLSPRYIAYWRSFFDDKATGLQSNPVQSDIPEGFDIDFVLSTQEPELILYHISQTIFKPQSITDTFAVIGLSWPVEDGMQYNVEMHKNKQGWQIDHIATIN